MLLTENRIRNKTEFKEWINLEKEYYPTSIIQGIFMIGENAVLKRHQYLLRKTELYVNNNNKFLSLYYKIRLYKIQNKFSIHVPLNCCGKGFRLMHVGPILINGNATIGQNCTMHMNSSIVASGPHNTVPTLADNVVVGYGACIVGGVYVAEGVAIGANSVVCKSINEPNIAIAGVPAKKVSDNGKSRWNQNG